MNETLKENFLKEKKNKFEIILIAAKRARDISLNNNKFSNNLNEKPPIIALKEIELNYKEQFFFDEKET